MMLSHFGGVTFIGNGANSRGSSAGTTSGRGGLRGRNAGDIRDDELAARVIGDAVSVPLDDLVDSW
jgi:hypothetical protein